jgi:hypothetical protein
MEPPPPTRFEWLLNYLWAILTTAFSLIMFIINPALDYAIEKRNERRELLRCGEEGEP